ncbi:hypothetical protein GCM10010255_62480 [Streptomyces coeruleofuscus]|uniref:Uncharacterized protein n=1 Tax=Streptomyces coeruleofuscus TaxID=66879 RepID=A0ABN3IY26_9ACTN
MPSSTTETPSAYRSEAGPVTKVGGSLDNRIRFAVEAATAVADENGHTDHPTHTA